MSCTNIYETIFMSYLGENLNTDWVFEGFMGLLAVTAGRK